jgi:Asp-tRNA(Asn)/Glu-tRNA(Gln) amidotransferase A subunit family amidase
MDLCATPAVELARLIRARELSAAELLAAGLPVGLQLVGRYGADRRLLEIAAAIMELATGSLS